MDLPVLVISSMPPDDATVAALGPRRGRLRRQAVPGRPSCWPGSRPTSGPDGRLEEAREREARSRSRAGRHPPGDHRLALAGRDLPGPGPADGVGAPDLQLLDRARQAERRNRHRGGGLRESRPSATSRIELKRYPELLGPLKTQEPLLIADVQSDAFLSQARERWRLEGRIVPTTSVAAIPFQIHGERRGVFFLRTTGDDDPPLEAGRRLCRPGHRGVGRCSKRRTIWRTRWPARTRFSTWPRPIR